jgi:probable HAF family extracellular repeat protein
MMKSGVVGLMALAALVGVADRAAAEYLITSFGSVGEGSLVRTYVSDINDAGQYVGGVPGHFFWWDLQDTQGFLFDGKSTVLLTQEELRVARPNAINASGDVVGSISGHPFIYRGGKMTELDFQGRALGINSTGQIVGNAAGPFLYSGGEKRELNAALAATGKAWGGGEARAINDAGLVVGYTYVDSDLHKHAFVYDSKTGQAKILPPFSPNGFNESRANDVNNQGQVVGMATTQGLRTRRPFLYMNGKMIDIGYGGEGEARAINDAGEIVGQYNGYAFLYRDGKLIDLNSLISPESHLKLIDAWKINNKGQIIATAIDVGGAQQNVLLTPSEVPEPGSLALLGMGGAGLAGYAWRRRKRGERATPPGVTTVRRETEVLSPALGL